MSSYDAVIVLGGCMNPVITADTGKPAWNESAERLLTAYDLLRTNRAKNAILSGGSWTSAQDGVKPEARVMAEQLESLGIDPLDSRSKSTPPIRTRTPSSPRASLANAGGRATSS